MHQANKIKLKEIKLNTSSKHKGPELTLESFLPLAPVPAPRVLAATCGSELAGLLSVERGEEEEEDVDMGDVF